MIEILSQSALATVQDAGRTGALRWGVGTAGAMDRMALACGNLLLGNPEGAAAIEVQVFPFEVRFSAEVVFAVTGADCGATLDGVPLLPWSAAAAADGAVLRLGLPEAARWRGSRAYLCVGGGIDVPVVLGSRATQLRGAIGGLDGRALRQGDRVPTGSAPSDVPDLGLGLVPPALALPLERDGMPAVRVLPAAEYEGFTAASREAFWGEPWKVTPQSDRYGFRLAGPSLVPVKPHGAALPRDRAGRDSGAAWRATHRAAMRCASPRADTRRSARSSRPISGVSGRRLLGVACASSRRPGRRPWRPATRLRHGSPA